MRARRPADRSSEAAPTRPRAGARPSPGGPRPRATDRGIRSPRRRGRAPRPSARSPLLPATHAPGIPDRRLAASSGSPGVPEMKKPAPPRVSVVTPTRDRARYLGLAIDSALGQGIPGLEVIVVDDG